ncbi:hypothetical protein D3C86_1844010 [compost metagenome]
MIEVELVFVVAGQVFMDEDGQHDLTFWHGSSLESLSGDGFFLFCCSVIELLSRCAQY